MLPEEKILKELLLGFEEVTPRIYRQAERSSRKSSSSPYTYLIEENIITRKQFGDALAKYFSTTHFYTDKPETLKEIVLKQDQEYSENFRAALVEITEQAVTVATDSPLDTKLHETLREVYQKKKIYMKYALPSTLNSLLALFRETIETEFPKLLTDEKVDISQLLNTVIDDAIKHDISDIHIDPMDDDVLIRFRNDGDLLEAGRLTHAVYENLLNLIKVSCEMRTDIHLQTQDGSMRITRGKVAYDLRASIVPTIKGEKVVMRMLTSYVKVLGLGEIGLQPKYQEMLEKAIEKPYGIVVISGPTGSGKSTTLYSLLKSRNRYGQNVMTLEDPVEFRIPGVNQIQVNPEAKVTFASGLRALVRQDPDVILLGEVRDAETAEISVNAALTGILLFTTFHAGDAAITIPRLIDMGIEPFLLASALELIMSQRLIRRICTECKKEKTIKVTSLKDLLPSPTKYFKTKTLKVSYGEGCEKCGGTGYDGRIAIFESIQITPDMKDLILKRPTAKEVWKLAKKEGSVSLFEDGITKVVDGISTIEEVLRVAQPVE